MIFSCYLPQCGSFFLLLPSHCGSCFSYVTFLSVDHVFQLLPGSLWLMFFSCYLPQCSSCFTAVTCLIVVHVFQLLPASVWLMFFSCYLPHCGSCFSAVTCLSVAHASNTVVPQQSSYTPGTSITVTCTGSRTTLLGDTSATYSCSNTGIFENFLPCNGADYYNTCCGICNVGGGGGGGGGGVSYDMMQSSGTIRRSLLKISLCGSLGIKYYERCIHILYYILDFVEQKSAKFTKEQPYQLSIVYCQYHACWCPGSLTRQGINRYDIDQISRNILCLAPQGLS